jgi:uncharacterized protein (TIGR00266 family)
MMALEGDVSVKTHTAGGVVKGLLRRMLVGETLFMNTFRAGRGGGVVWLAPASPGHVQHIELGGEGVIIQDMSFLAYHGRVKHEIVWRGLRGMVSEGNLFWLRVHGHGGVWVNSYGYIIERDLMAGEEMTIDNFHLVALSDDVDWRVRSFGNLKSFFFGGEGFIVDVRGPGKVYMQTRTMPELALLVKRFLGEKGSSGFSVSLS